MTEPEPALVARAKAESVLSRASRRLTGDGWVFDPAGAGMRVPAIAAGLAVGTAYGRPLAGVLAAGGAFTVGFGAPLDLRGSSPLLLAIASFAIGASAIVGSLAAAHVFVAIAVAAGFGALCGVAAPRSAGQAWIALQCGLAGMIATSYPASLDGAIDRAILIAAGGLAQATALAFAGITRHRFQKPAPPDPEAPRYALHLALALATALGLERALALRNGYWVPMTTLLVLRPGTHHTLARAIARTVGTFGGAGVASVLLVVLHPTGTTLAVLVVVAASGAYLFQKATYGLFSACVTMYVVFLMSFAGLAEEQVAVARIVATALGATIGILVQLADGAVAKRKA